MGQESINIMLDKFQYSTKHFTYTSPTIQWYSTEYELPIGWLSVKAQLTHVDTSLIFHC